jgi:hypothetical protein
MSALQILVDLEQGEIRLGSEQIRLLPVAGDVFCLNDARGPLVRALKFQERSALLSDAADKDVASLIADAALVSSGVATDEIRVAASLALAGGGEEAPSFPDCAEFVAQRFGWDEVRVAGTMALLVDRLCGKMVQQEANGWKQIVFQKTDADLGSLISQMATNLAQRAVTLHARTESEATDKKKSQQPGSHQPSRSIERSEFENLSASTAPRETVESASSVFPVKRAPFRVLALNTDFVKPGPIEFPDPEKDPFVTSQSKHRSMSKSTTTIPETALRTDFPAVHKPQTDRANFSLSQAAAAPARSELSQAALAPAKIESLDVSQPVATFPAWQPFATSSANAQRSSEPARTSSRGFNATETLPQSTNDWLAELAQLLEAECDLRGIDP